LISRYDFDQANRFSVYNDVDRPDTLVTQHWLAAYGPGNDILRILAHGACR
jgi:hypothetical protein